MRINTLNEAHPATWIVEDTSHAHEHLHDARKLVEVCRPRLITTLHEYLGEATYRELANLIDPNFLDQKVRSSMLKRVEYVGFNGDTMQFLVPSSEYDKNHIKYANLVQFSDWEEIGQKEGFDAREKANLMLWYSNVKLHCSCPSFLYWGYQAILSVLDSAIFPEERKPVVRNPHERGIVCKHGNKLLQVLPFQSGRIASEIKSQFGD